MIDDCRVHDGFVNGCRYPAASGWTWGATVAWWFTLGETEKARDTKDQLFWLVVWPLWKLLVKEPTIPNIGENKQSWRPPTSPQILHSWYIYLNLDHFRGKCREAIHGASGVFKKNNGCVGTPDAWKIREHRDATFEGTSISSAQRRVPSSWHPADQLTICHVGQLTILWGFRDPSWLSFMDRRMPITQSWPEV